MLCLAPPPQGPPPLSLPDRSPTDPPGGGSIAIQAIEANDHVGQRKRELVGIRCHHAARQLEFMTILAIAGISKRAEPLVCVRLQNRGPRSGHFSTLAPQM